MRYTAKSFRTPDHHTHTWFFLKVGRTQLWPIELERTLLYAVVLQFPFTGMDFVHTADSLRKPLVL